MHVICLAHAVGYTTALSLLWIHTFTSLILTLLTCWVTQPIRRDESRYCSAGKSSTASLFSMEIVWHVAIALLEVSTNVCLVQGLFHARSITLPFLVYYLGDFLVSFIKRSRLLQSVLINVYAAGIIVLASLPFLAVMFIGERKLGPKSLILLLGAASYISKNLLELYLSSKSDTANLRSPWARPLTLSISLILTTAIFLGVERPFVFAYGGFQKISTSFHVAFLLPSVVISILDVLEGSNIGLQIGDGPEAKCSDVLVDCAITKSILDIIAIFVPGYLLALQTPTWIQIISYVIFTLVSSLGVLAFNRQASSNSHMILLPRDTKAELENDEMEEYTALHENWDGEETTDQWTKTRAKGGRHGWLARLWVFGFGLIATKLTLELAIPEQTSNLSQTHRKGLLADTVPSTRRLDLVISYYNEDLHKLRTFVDSVNNLPRIQQLQPHVIVYTKNQKSNVSEIQSVIGADEVTLLPNKGREGGTYLHHIVNRWTDIANHTIFMQAEPHVPARTIKRLKSYFDPTRTGMLDLGFRELRSCSCLDCRDEYGWTDEAGLIPELMADAHNVNCDKNTRVSLSYKGQFLVSANRIRSVQKTIYEKLNRELLGEDRIRLGGEEDSVDKPVLGYTLERSWGILFQCADLTGTRDMCPGLTGPGIAIGDLRPARPEDCGCLDV
ncbi:hypothetical protein TWF696_001631 [Orbilia brochopaga]|uniref:Uncharacterized protein n=1 Tax=Orbilia brochopaga TaxID=3140254 RepID=A0AAV9U9G0_9PEZI